MITSGFKLCTKRQITDCLYASKMFQMPPKVAKEKELGNVKFTT